MEFFSASEERKKFEKALLNTEKTDLKVTGEEIKILLSLASKILELKKDLEIFLVESPDRGLQYHILSAAQRKIGSEVGLDQRRWFLTHGFKRKGKSNLAIDLISPFGRQEQLPRNEIISEKVAFLFIQKTPCLVSAVFTGHTAHVKDAWYSEQKWIERETALFIAAISLECGHGFSFFPHRGYPIDIPSDLYGIKSNPFSKKNISITKELVKNYIEATSVLSDISNFDNAFSYSEEVDEKAVKNLLVKMDRKDSVLMRCLYYFAKASVIRNHPMFSEEATGLLLFCLDGVVKLIMKRNKIPKYEDLAAFLKKDLGIIDTEFLTVLYEYRTSYVHPANHYENSWCPAFTGCLAHESWDIARDLLNYLLMGVWKPTYDGFLPENQWEE